ncbi:MAG: hypothetical protein KDA42_08015 [Planctomycetales bacterium]|nr:hypothetical protein [Planctomycetales bacterium]
MSPSNRHSDESTSRRSFLVVCEAAIIGSFRIPSLEGAQPYAGEVEACGPDPSFPSDARVLLARPKFSQNRKVLVWLESKDGEAVLMRWRIDDDADRVEAERFYQHFHERSWYTFEELKATPRRAGSFVIRTDILPKNWLYLGSRDESLVFGADDQVKIYFPDPADAVVFDHDTAIYWVLRLMDFYEFGEDEASFFEAVPRDEALAEYTPAAVSIDEHLDRLRNVGDVKQLPITDSKPEA